MWGAVGTDSITVKTVEPSEKQSSRDKEAADRAAGSQNVGITGSRGIAPRATGDPGAIKDQAVAIAGPKKLQCFDL